MNQLSKILSTAAAGALDVWVGISVGEEVEAEGPAALFLGLSLSRVTSTPAPDGGLSRPTPQVLLSTPRENRAPSFSWPCSPYVLEGRGPRKPGRFQHPKEAYP